MDATGSAIMLAGLVTLAFILFSDCSINKCKNSCQNMKIVLAIKTFAA